MSLKRTLPMNPRVREYSCMLPVCFLLLTFIFFRSLYDTIVEPAEKSYDNLNYFFSKNKLSVSARANFFNSLEPCVYSDGMVIVKQGNVKGNFYIIAQGIVKCCSNVNESMGVYLYEGDHFGEIRLDRVLRYN